LQIANVARVIMSTTMRWAEYVADKRVNRKARRKETGRDGVQWINLVKFETSDRFL
jgi:hypothetical protein